MQKQICVYMASLKSHLGFEARTCCLHPHMDAHHFCQAYTLCNVEKSAIDFIYTTELSFSLLFKELRTIWFHQRSYFSGSFLHSQIRIDRLQNILARKNIQLENMNGSFISSPKTAQPAKKNRKSIGPFPYQWQMLVCKMSPTPLMRSYGRMSCKKGSFQQMHHNDELSKAVAQYNSRVIWQCPTWLTFGLSSAKRRGRHSPVILIHGPNLYQSRIYEREVSRGISQH